MVFALVHYPNIDARRINQFRRKYDPQADLIEPHITLMFPLPESVGEERLVAHLEGVLKSWQPFPLHLRGLQRSWDGYLFLTVQEGGADIIGLHDEIYTGMLAGYRRDDIPFVPHLTLGVFSEHASGYHQALGEAERLGLDYRCRMDRLHLLKLYDDRSRIVWSREFRLAA
jgi:2'-5' RNA ligase